MLAPMMSTRSWQRVIRCNKFSIGFPLKTTEGTGSASADQCIFTAALGVVAGVLPAVLLILTCAAVLSVCFNRKLRRQLASWLAWPDPSSSDSALSAQDDVFFKLNAIKFQQVEHCTLPPTGFLVPRSSVQASQHTWPSHSSPASFSAY